jgi:hypothetical protein
MCTEADNEIRTIFTTKIGVYQRRLLTNRLTALRSRYGDKKICEEWSAPDGIGARRFAVWLWQQYNALPDVEKKSNYCLVRRRKSGKWSPGNCHLVLKRDHLKYKPRIRIPDEIRAQIVEMAKNRPNIKLREIALSHPYSLGALSNILRQNIGTAYDRRCVGALV